MVPVAGISSLDEPLLYHLFTFFNIHDLSIFACTCKQFNNRIASYYEQTCKDKKVAEYLLLLIDHKVVLESEKQLKTKICDHSYTYKWLYTTWRSFRKVYRESVQKLWIPELRNLSYIHYNFKNIHCFQNVSKGCYKLVLRLKMDKMMFDEPSPKKQERDSKSEINWDTWKKLKDSPLELIVRVVHRESHNVTAADKIPAPNAVETSINLEVCEGLNDSFLTSAPRKFVDFSVTNYNSHDGWFNLVMRAFTVCETSDVVFEFKDVDARWLLSGLLWDFAEMITD